MKHLAGQQIFFEDAAKGSGKGVGAKCLCRAAFAIE
jgi:hypothetical protein